MMRLDISRNIMNSRAITLRIVLRKSVKLTLMIKIRRIIKLILNIRVIIKQQVIELVRSFYQD